MKRNKTRKKSNFPGNEEDGKVGAFSLDLARRHPSLRAGNPTAAAIMNASYESIINAHGNNTSIVYI